MGHVPSALSPPRSARSTGAQGTGRVPVLDVETCPVAGTHRRRHAARRSARRARARESRWSPPDAQLASRISRACARYMLKSCRGSAPDLRAGHQDAPSHGAQPLDAQLASRGRDPRAPGAQPGCQCSASRRTQWPAHIAGGVPLDAQLAARDHEMMPLRPSRPSGSSSQHRGTPSHWAKHLGAQPVVLSASRGCSGHSQGAGAGRRRAPHDRPSAPGACHSTLSS